MWTPPDMNTLQDHCDAVHEMYESLTNAGFTKHEAMHVLLQDPCCKETS